MLNLLGEYYCKVDSKGRVRLPSELLTQLGMSSGGTHAFVVAPGVGKYLQLHTNAHWQEESGRLAQLNRHNSEHRRLLQMRFRGASNVKLDSADRLNIPASLRERYNIEDKVVISCFLDQIEIWAHDEFMADLESMSPEEIDRLENSILGGVGVVAPPVVHTDNLELPG